MRKCPALNGLALANCIQLSDIAVYEIATYKPDFRYLELKGCKKITDNAIMTMSKLCGNFQYIDLSGTQVTDKG